jgi:hypothetical protein
LPITYSAHTPHIIVRLPLVFVLPCALPPERK